MPQTLITMMANRTMMDLASEHPICSSVTIMCTSLPS